MDDPITFLGGDPVTFKQGVLEAVAGLLDGRTEARVAVFAHGIPINVVLSHILGLRRTSGTHFLPDYCSLTRVSGPSLNDMSVLSFNETAHLVDGEPAPASALEAGARG